MDQRMNAIADRKAKGRTGLPLAHIFQSFRGDTRAMAAIEYALVLPILILILAIVVVGGQALAIHKKVVLTSGALADLVTQYSTLSSATMTTVLGVGASTMAPYGVANLSVVVSEVQTNSTGVGTVTWSRAANNGTALTAGSSFTLTRLLRMPNMTYIVGQVSYVYSPTNILQRLGPMTLSNTSYLSPRLSTNVTLTP